MDQQVGLLTQYLNFERVVNSDPELHPFWVPVHYKTDGQVSPLYRILPASVRGTAQGVSEIRYGLGAAGQWDAALWATWAAKSVVDLVGRAPSFLVMDMTPIQMEEMGERYGYTRARARFLGGLKRRQTETLYKQAEHFFPWNEWVGRSLVSDYGVDESRVTAISPGVDPTLYRPDPKRRADDGIVRLLFVGGAFARKGGELLLRWARESSVETPWELHIVTRDEVPPTDNVVIHHNIANNSQDLVQLYQACDLFVLPTLADCFSLVGLEAMASGLPIVISSLGGIPEIVDEGDTGYLIEPGDYETFARRVNQLIEDKPLRERMGRNGRVKVLQKHDSGTNVRSILNAMVHAAERSSR